MKIQYRPLYEMAEITHVMSNMVWKLNEIKDIPADASYRARVGGEVFQIRLIDDLLSDPNFVAVESDSNPNFQCASCGADTLELGEMNPMGITHIFENPQGERLCKNCFAKPVPAEPDKE